MKNTKEFIIKFPVKYYTEEQVETDIGKDEKGNSMVSKETMNVPHTIMIGIKNPSRKQIDEASLEYSSHFGMCMKKGCLTKAMLAKLYADQGGAMGKEDAAHLEKLYMDLEKTNSEIQRFNTQLVRAKELKENDHDMILSYGYKSAKIKREIVDIESSYLSLFQNTAEHQAQNRMALWYMLELTHVQKNDKWEPYFNGKNVEEKTECYYKLEELGDEMDVYQKIRDRSILVLSFWMVNPNSDEDAGLKFLQEELENITEFEDKSVSNISKDGPEKTEAEGRSA